MVYICRTGVVEKEGGEQSKGTGSKVVITGAVENSQAERVFEASGVRPFMQHATIVAVNGKSFKGDFSFISLFILFEVWMRTV